MSDFVNIKLPSRFKVYKDIDPEAVQIRILKGKDEKLIAEMNQNNIELKFAELLRNVMQGIDPKDLTLGDRKFVLLWLSMNSYQTTTPVEFECEFCGKAIRNFHVDMAEFEMRELADDFEEPYKVDLLKSGQTVYLRLLRVKDEIDIANRSKRSDDTWLYRYALTIVDEEKTIDEKVAWLEELPAHDIAQIKAVQEKYTHGPVMEAPYTCPQCQEDGTVAVPFRLEMVFPFGATLQNVYGKTV